MLIIEMGIEIAEMQCQKEERFEEKKKNCQETQSWGQHSSVSFPNNVYALVMHVSV